MEAGRASSGDEGTREAPRAHLSAAGDLDALTHYHTIMTDRYHSLALSSHGVDSRDR